MLQKHNSLNFQKNAKRDDPETKTITEDYINLAKLLTQHLILVSVQL